LLQWFGWLCLFVTGRTSVVKGYNRPVLLWGELDGPGCRSMTGWACVGADPSDRLEAEVVREDPVDTDLVYVAAAV